MSLPRPHFPDDDGSGDPRVTAALAGYAAGRVGEYTLLAALAVSRLLVPVVAVRVEKESEMALPTLVGADGRRAVPGFTSLATLTGWRPDARPVAVRFRDACLAAVDEGADALIVDVAGPATYVVEAGRLELLAGGMITPPHETPEVLAAVAAVRDAVPGAASVTAGPGTAAELAVQVSFAPGTDQDAVLKVVAAEVSARVRGLIVGPVEITAPAPPTAPTAPDLEG